MSALFRPRANTIFRVVLFVLLVGVLGGVSWFMVWARTPYGTRQYEAVQQPVQFDHRHHVADDGIDCRYCHATVETSAYAGIPPTATCMNCHNQVWNQSAMLEPVRRAWFTAQPIVWKRVHQLPDFVYFNHSIHVNKGVGCATCHGRVDRMPAIQRVSPLTMGWFVK